MFFLIYALLSTNFVELDWLNPFSMPHISCPCIYLLLLVQQSYFFNGLPDVTIWTFSLCHEFLLCYKLVVVCRPTTCLPPTSYYAETNPSCRNWCSVIPAPMMVGRTSLIFFVGLLRAIILGCLGAHRSARYDKTFGKNESCSSPWSQRGNRVQNCHPLPSRWTIRSPCG